MELVNNIAEQYAEKFTSSEDALMHAVNEHTMKTHPHAQMLSGHVQGKLLSMISNMINPKYILEIGTFVGYSAIYLSKGLQAGGELHTIELREDDASTARENFVKANVNDKIKLHVGDALQIIPTLKPQWDLVFLDADKVNYINYYELTLPQLRPGGFILADNVLFHGEVLSDEIKGKNAKAIHAFNEHVKADGRTEQVMLTVRDGLFAIRKL